VPSNEIDLEATDCHLTRAVSVAAHELGRQRHRFGGVVGRMVLVHLPVAQADRLAVESDGEASSCPGQVGVTGLCGCLKRVKLATAQQVAAMAVQPHLAARDRGVVTRRWRRRASDEQRCQPAPHRCTSPGSIACFVPLAHAVLPNGDCVLMTFVDLRNLQKGAAKRSGRHGPSSQPQARWALRVAPLAPWPFALGARARAANVYRELSERLPNAPR
jgi:hypothetical protein